jgi:hypothetical protein
MNGFKPIFMANPNFMKKPMHFKDSILKSFTWKEPAVFTIPLGLFEDEMQKVRDKKSFLKLRKLSTQDPASKPEIRGYL